MRRQVADFPHSRHRGRKRRHHLRPVVRGPVSVGVQRVCANRAAAERVLGAHRQREAREARLEARTAAIQQFLPKLAAPSAMPSTAQTGRPGGARRQGGIRFRFSALRPLRIPELCYLSSQTSSKRQPL